MEVFCLLRKTNIEDLNQVIEAKRKDVSKTLFSERIHSPKTKRTRTRTNDERKALTKITKATIDNAIKNGELKFIGKRKLYYGPPK